MTRIPNAQPAEMHHQNGNGLRTMYANARYRLLGWLIGVVLFFTVLRFYLDLDPLTLLIQGNSQVLFSVFTFWLAFVFAVLVPSLGHRRRSVSEMEGKLPRSIEVPLPRPSYLLLPESPRCFLRVIILLIVIDTHLLFFSFMANVRQFGFSRGLGLYLLMTGLLIAANALFLIGERKRTRLSLAAAIEYYTLFAFLLLNVVISPVLLFKNRFFSDRNEKKSLSSDSQRGSSSLSSPSLERVDASLRCRRPLTATQELRLIVTIAVITVLASLALHFLPLKFLVTQTILYPGSPDFVLFQSSWELTVGPFTFTIMPAFVVNMLADISILLLLLSFMALFLLYWDDDPELGYYVKKERARLERMAWERYQSGELSREQLAEAITEAHHQACYLARQRLREERQRLREE